MAQEAIVERVVEAAGGTKALAEALGITREAIYLWEKVPPARVLDLERLTGIPRHELRPDYYPPPDKDAAA